MNSRRKHPTSRPTIPSTEPRATGDAFAGWVYRLRWPLSVLVLVGVAFAARAGLGEVKSLTSNLHELGDTTTGLGAQPLLFDPRMDIWFDGDDEGVLGYRKIEDKFVAEDYVIVAFEDDTSELGVFSRESLATIARLTREISRVPGVRHVRSLTSSPWIRSGKILEFDGEDSGARGLVISDLIELTPEQILSPEHLSDDEIFERMIAVLGARRAAERVGQDAVRRVIGSEASLDDHFGEPLLLGTIVDERATTTAIQIQVLRARVGEDRLDAVFGNESKRRAAAPALFSVQSQHAALRGIDHVLRVERGLAIRSEHMDGLEAWLATLPPGQERQRVRNELDDPTRNFVRGQDGELVRKYHEYETDGKTGWVDRSNSNDVVHAPAEFQPVALSGYEFHVAGMPPFERNFMDVGMADAKYIVLVMLLICAMLIVFFRSVVGIVAPMFVVFGSIVAMMGAVIGAGDLMNNLTAISPNMLTAVGIADAIHLVSAWAVLRGRYSDRETLIVEVIRLNALPVFLTTITTAIGFYSLTVSQILPVNMLGYTAGLGTLVAYLLSMTVVPALLSLVPVRGGAKEGDAEQPSSDSDERSTRSERLADWVLAKRVTILTVSGVLVAVTAFGMSRFAIDTDFRAMFPDDNRVMGDFHWIESRLGGVGDVEIVFNGMDTTTDLRAFDADRERLAELELAALGSEQHPEEFPVLSAEEDAELERLRATIATIERSRIGASAEFYAELERFERRLLDEMSEPGSALAVLTDITSPLDILRKINQVQNANRAASYRVPDAADVSDDARVARLEFEPWTEEWIHTPGQDAASLIAQYLLQYENGARPGENLSTQISADRRFFRMQGRAKQAPTTLHQRAFDRIAAIAEEEFPRLAGRVSSDVGGAPMSELVVSGKTVLFSRTPDKFVRGFIESMGLALVIITLLIALIFRSIPVALISIVPNVLPILMPLSVFGLRKTPLDGPTILVASVALGVCVDDTIHFFSKFMRARRRGMDMRASLTYVYSQVGRALTTTTVVLVIGFAGLVFSDFRPNYMIGSLAVIMFVLAWIADMFVTPALLSFLPRYEPAGARDASATARLPDVAPASAESTGSTPVH